MPFRTQAAPLKNICHVGVQTEQAPAQRIGENEWFGENRYDEEFGSSENTVYSIRLRQRQKFENLQRMFSGRRQEIGRAAEILKDSFKMHRARPIMEYGSTATAHAGYLLYGAAFGGTTS